MITDKIKSLQQICKTGFCEGIRCKDCYFCLENGQKYLCRQLTNYEGLSDIRCYAKKILREYKLKRIINET